MCICSAAHRESRATRRAPSRCRASRPARPPPSAARRRRYQSLIISQNISKYLGKSRNISNYLRHPQPRERGGGYGRRRGAPPRAAATHGLRGAAARGGEARRRPVPAPIGSRALPQQVRRRGGGLSGGGGPAEGGGAAVYSGRWEVEGGVGWGRWGGPPQKISTDEPRQILSGGGLAQQQQQLEGNLRRRADRRTDAAAEENPVPAYYCVFGTLLLSTRPAAQVSRSDQFQYRYVSWFQLKMVPLAVYRLCVQ
eukprot:SAG31_NODE_1261_length_9072_cov_39.512761_7_plen_254_part_00